MSYRWTPAAEAQELALRTLLESLVLPIGVHGLSEEYILQLFSQRIPDSALHPAAGIHVTRWQDGHMTVSAVAAVIDDAVNGVCGNLEQPVLMEEKGPQVVLQIEGCLAILIEFELLPTCFKQGSIFPGRNMIFLFSACRTIPAEGEYVRAVLYREGDDFRNFSDVFSGHRGHDGAADSSVPYAWNLLQRCIEGTGFPDGIVRLPRAVDGQLVFVASEFRETPAFAVQSFKNPRFPILQPPEIYNGSPTSRWMIAYYNSL